MLDQVAFTKCIRANLKERRFGKERADEIVKEFEARTAGYKTQGKSEVDAALLAMNDTFENISAQAKEKAKRTAKMLAVQAQNIERVEQGLTANMKLFDKKGESSRGQALAMAAISLIEHDPRFTGLSYNGTKEIIRGQLFAVMNDVVEKSGKGFFGRQKGKSHLPNIVREIFGEETSDLAAKDLARGWLKTSDLGVDLFNEAGGSLGKLERYIPDPMNSMAKMAGADLKGIKATKSVRKKMLKQEAYRKFKKIALESWDWQRMKWPDGSRIEPKQYDEVIENVFATKALDGANKIDPKAFRGQGKALGNMVENHRFVHYKSADGWLKAHEAFGDGSIFDTIVRHVEDMSHRVAMVETFGPNPDLAANNLEAIVRSKAADLGKEEIGKADAILKNKFRPMMDIISRANPMDPESLMGNVGTGLANILTSAQLGAASLLAIPGDTMQTLATRAANNLPLFGGIDYYFKSLATDPAFMNKISTQAGFIADDLVASTYATTRFTGIATVGPATTRRVSDAVMRASLMSGHTKSARRAVQQEFMGMLHRDRGTAFDDLPYAAMMERYGITANDWDLVRKNAKTHSPKKGVEFLRPIDMLETELDDNVALFRKFQGMIIEEARTGVPEATISAAVTLRGTERPDTLRGLLLHSFSMYKNFPISFVTIYGRLGMTSPSVKGRLGFYAGLGAGMTMVGAMGLQMREVSKGRDPMPMDDPRFWGKSLLAGGALSIYGDFLFNGVNQYGSGPQDVVAGPLSQLLGDSTSLVFGDGFSFVQAMSGDEEFDFKTAEKSVQFAKRYTPGTSIWWARLALERQVWDRLEELADPKAYRKQQRRMRTREREYGNEYWWPLGERGPERPPQYQGSE